MTSSYSGFYFRICGTWCALERCSNARHCDRVTGGSYLWKFEVKFAPWLIMENFSAEELELPPCKYEYLDHTADVQLHAWGDSLKEAYEQCGLAMFGYMTEIQTVEIKQCSEIEATGHDLESLLFHFLDELLFLFSCEPFLICNKLVITEFVMENEEEYRIKCKCYGEEFQLGKHPQGTEVKAITYSAMQIINEPDKNRYEVYVIIDI